MFSLLSCMNGCDIPTTRECTTGWQSGMIPGGRGHYTLTRVMCLSIDPPCSQGCTPNDPYILWFVTQWPLFCSLHWMTPLFEKLEFLNFSALYAQFKKKIWAKFEISMCLARILNKNLSVPTQNFPISLHYVHRMPHLSIVYTKWPPIYNKFVTYSPLLLKPVGTDTSLSYIMSAPHFLSGLFHYVLGVIHNKSV